MDEFELIDRYFRFEVVTSSTEAQETALTVANGDDASVFSVTSNASVCVSVDSYKEGVHFPVGANAERVARRTLACALSDLAAMGAQPNYFTLALSLPEPNDKWLSQFSSGLRSLAEVHGIQLIGGDTIRGDLMITYQVMGTISGGDVLTRSGAQQGDLLCITGPTGLSKAALVQSIETSQVYSGDPGSAFEQALSKATESYWCPEPRFHQGQFLVRLATSCIDISDGLMSEAQHLSKASQKTIHIDLDAIPQAPEVTMLGGDQALEWTLYGGDDYELLFTLPKTHLAAVCETFPETRAIGYVGSMSNKAFPDVRCYSDTGISIDAYSAKRGYQHFD